MAIFDVFADLKDTPPLGQYPKTVPPDVRFVHPTDRLLVEYLLDTKTRGPFIAGGACLAWYLNEPVKTDIDLYFTSFEQFRHYNDFWINDLPQKFSKTLTAETANAITYKIYDTQIDLSHTVQFICKNFYATLEDVLDSFDITVCKIGIDKDRVLTRSTFALDVKDRLIRFDHVSPQSHKRLVKYMAYGYDPAPGELEKICNSSQIDWLSVGTDHYA